MDNHNVKTSKQLFCFFSGYTKGIGEITKVKSNDKLKIYEMNIKLPEGMDFPNLTYVQLDGVLGQVVDSNENQITVNTTFELAENTTLKEVRIGKKISLGILAEMEKLEDQNFLIHPSASLVATVENISILTGHRYTLKIDLSCQSNKLKLEEEKHIGFSGSSLLVRELKQKDGLYHFSIYAGKQTQEKTAFNKQLLHVGDKVNITLPKMDTASTVPYPYELQSIKPK